MTARQTEPAARLGPPSLEARFEPMSPHVIEIQENHKGWPGSGSHGLWGHGFLGVCRVGTWEGTAQARGPASQSPPCPLHLLFLRRGSSCASQSSSATWASSRTASRKCYWSMATAASKRWRSWWPVPSDLQGTQQRLCILVLTRTWRCTLTVS